MRKLFSFLDRPISWLYIFWMYGERCTEVSDSCHCCKKWQEHDELFTNKR